MVAGLGCISPNHGPDPYALEATASPFVPDLRVNHDSASLIKQSSAMSMRGGGSGGSDAGSAPTRLAIRSSRGGTLYVGKIRMGFGHHRIAYAASSWGLDSGMGTYFHDLLNIKSPEANIIKKGDG